MLVPLAVLLLLRQLHQLCNRSGHQSRWWWGLSLLPGWSPVCLLFQKGFYKWWRILDHIIARAGARGRDPALGFFSAVFVLAEIKMVSYESKRVRLGGAVPQGLCMQFRSFQWIFKMEVVKYIHSDLIETWNLGLGGLFVSDNYFGITFFQFIILNESFNRLCGNSVSLYS